MSLSMPGEEDATGGVTTVSAECELELCEGIQCLTASMHVKDTSASSEEGTTWGGKLGTGEG